MRLSEMVYVGPRDCGFGCKRIKGRFLGMKQHLGIEPIAVHLLRWRHPCCAIVAAMWMGVDFVVGSWGECSVGLNYLKFFLIERYVSYGAEIENE
jgi:hypothetical protein